MSGRVAVVGNGPIAPGTGAEIDGADWVLRFNEPTAGPETVGARTDILFLVNSGKSAQARLENGFFRRSPAFAAARRVVLPLHPSAIARHHPKPNLLSRLKGRKADWTVETLEACRAAGKETEVLSARFYGESCDALRIGPTERTKLFPSTGFLGLRYALWRFPPPEWDVVVRGFGWQGWKRHPWAAERAWAQAQAQDGRLILP